MFLFFAALVGGALNSVAGGGSFIALPALLYAGVNPVAANATTTLALWPGSVASAFAYRRDIALTGGRLAVLTGVSLVGGLVGAVLLVRTSDTSFMRLLPWLMLAGAVTFTFGGRRAATEAQRHGEKFATEAQSHGDRSATEPQRHRGQSATQAQSHRDQFATEAQSHGDESATEARSHGDESATEAR
ncbi:MAG TPA: sulfite exporter TauE/SafE family protein, partial [Vicinamibacterales bacterium]|nr:sulfite exporter TauE/SafE family protein [Vicinamibacterales bacterium]